MKSNFIIHFLILTLLLSCSKEDVPGIIPDVDDNGQQEEPVIPDDFDGYVVECDVPYLHLSYNPATDICGIDGIWVDEENYDGNILYPSNGSTNPEDIRIIPKDIVIPDYAKLINNSTKEERQIPITQINDVITTIFVINNNHSPHIGESPGGFTYDIKNNYLTSIEFNSFIKDIPNDCFNNSPTLKKAILKAPLTTIGSCAFSNCPLLNDVTLPSTLKTIKSGAFNKCEYLREITLPDALETIENEAFSNSGLNSIKLPGSITKLDKNIFNNCKSLRKVTSEMTFLPQDAIMNCVSLNEVIFTGNNLTLSCSFKNCVALKKITSHADSPIKVSSHILQEMPGDVIFHVKKSLKPQYEADPVWKDFLNKVNFDNL